MTIRVVTMGDHLLALQAVAAALQDDPDTELVATTRGSEELLQAVRQSQPGVTVLDFSIRAHAANPPAIVAALRSACPATNILALVSRADGILALELIEAGALGCLLCDDEEALALAGAVRAVAAGQRVYSRDILYRHLELSRHPLPPQALSVLRLVADGLTNAAIARRLSISDRTVRNCLTEAYAVLGVWGNGELNPRVNAINKARSLGWL